MTDADPAARAEDPAAPPAGRRPGRIVFVTGLNGAGKSTALKVLEDLGYESVDNIPLSLLGGLLRPDAEDGRPIAVGVDIRTRDFGVEPFLARLDELRSVPGQDVRVLFLDCDREVLRRRFTATRRRHPLALDRPVTDGIARERALVRPLRRRADVLIDTSGLSAADLRGLLDAHFRLDARAGMVLFVQSFSYGYGLPREADLVFDVRFLRNPHYDPDLRPLTGTDPRVGAHIQADADLAPFMDRLMALLDLLMPRYQAEGKAYLTVAVGCTGGRHRSVYVAERLAAWLSEGGRPVSLSHRDVDRPSPI